MSEYYKGKYLIALYDEEDFPFVVADNIIDLMERLEIPVNKITKNRMTSKISHALDRDNRKIRFKKKTLFIYLIPIKDVSTWK